MTRFRSFVEEHAEDIANPKLRFAGVIVNLHKNLNEHVFQMDGLRELVGDSEILEPVIPERAVIKEAAAAGASVAEYKSATGKRVAEMFDELAVSFLTKIGVTK